MVITKSPFLDKCDETHSFKFENRCSAHAKQQSIRMEKICLLNKSDDKKR